MCVQHTTKSTLFSSPGALKFFELYLFFPFMHNYDVVIVTVLKS